MKYLDNVVYNDESLQVRDVVARDQTTQLNTQLVETQTQVQSHDREITTLKSQMMGAQGDIEFLENRVTQCEEDIVSLDSSVGHLEQETSNLDSRVTTLENATSGLSQLETAVSQNTSEIGQLWDSVDIINNVNADQSTAINSLQTNQSEIQTHLSDIDDTIDDLDERITASTYEAGIGIYFGQGQEHTNINLEDEVLDKLAEIDTKTSITDSNDTLHTELKLSDDFKIENGVVYPDAKFIQLDSYGPVNPTHIKSVFDYVFNDLIDFQVGDIKTRNVYLEIFGHFYKISGFSGSLASDSSTRKLSFLASDNDKVYTHNIIEHFDGTNYSYTDEGIACKECIVLNSPASIRKAYQIIDADYDSSEQTVSHRFTPNAQFLLSTSITSITYDNDSYIVAPATIDVVLDTPMVYRAHALVYVQNTVTGYNFYELSVDITENPSTVSYTWTPIQMGGGSSYTPEIFTLSTNAFRTTYSMDQAEEARLIQYVQDHITTDSNSNYVLDNDVYFRSITPSGDTRTYKAQTTSVTSNSATFDFWNNDIPIPEDAVSSTTDTMHTMRIIVNYNSVILNPSYKSTTKLYTISYSFVDKTYSMSSTYQTALISFINTNLQSGSLRSKIGFKVSEVDNVYTNSTFEHTIYNVDTIVINHTDVSFKVMWQSKINGYLNIANVVVDTTNNTVTINDSDSNINYPVIELENTNLISNATNKITSDADVVEIFKRQPATVYAKVYRSYSNTLVPSFIPFDSISYTLNSNGSVIYFLGQVTINNSVGTGNPTVQYTISGTYSNTTWTVTTSTNSLPVVDDPYIQQISREPYQRLTNGNLAQLYKPGIYRNSATSSGGVSISNGPTPLNGTAPECIIEVINTGTTLPSGRGSMLIQKIYTDGVIYIRHRQYNYTTNAMEWKDWYSYTGTVVT